MKLCVPLHQIEVAKRCFLLRLAKVRIKAARRLRDKHLLAWMKERLAIYKEVKRLEEIARTDEEKIRLENIEKQRKKD